MRFPSNRHATLTSALMVCLFATAAVWPSSAHGESGLATAEARFDRAFDRDPCIALGSRHQRKLFEGLSERRTWEYLSEAPIRDVERPTHWYFRGVILAKMAWKSRSSAPWSRRAAAGRLSERYLTRFGAHATTLDCNLGDIARRLVLTGYRRAPVAFWKGYLKASPNPQWAHFVQQAKALIWVGLPRDAVEVLWRGLSTVDYYRSLRVAREPSLESARDKLEAAAEKWRLHGESPSRELYADHIYPALRVLTFIRMTQSPQRALAELRRLDFGPSPPHRLLAREESLRWLSGRINLDAEMPEPGRLAEQYRDSLVETFCLWPFDADGQYVGPRYRRLEGKRREVCEAVAPSEPSPPLRVRRPRTGEDGEDWNIHAVWRARLREAILTPSIPAARVASSRLRTAGMDIKWAHGPVNARMHPDMVDALIAPVRAAAPGYRELLRASWSSRLYRQPGPDPRERMLDELRDSGFAPAHVREVLELLRELGLWHEMARVVGPELDLSAQWPTTLIWLAEAHARSGDGEATFEAAAAFAATQQRPFVGYMRAARLVEQHELESVAVRLAERALGIRPSAPGPRALIARIQGGDAPDGWVEPISVKRVRLVDAIRSNADDDAVFDAVVDYMRAHQRLADSRGETVEFAFEVFVELEAHELALRLLDTRLPIVPSLAFESERWTRLLARLALGAGRPGQALAVVRTRANYVGITVPVARLLARVSSARGRHQDALFWAGYALRRNEQRTDEQVLIWELARAQVAAGCELAASHTFERYLSRSGRTDPTREEFAREFVVAQPADLTRMTRPTCR